MEKIHGGITSYFQDSLGQSSWYVLYACTDTGNKKMDIQL